MVSRLLLKEFDLVGVDPRAIPKGRRFPAEFYQVDYSRREMADVFKEHQFDSLLHLGRVRVTSRESMSSRFRLNVFGTRNLLSLAQKYGVKQFIMVSTYHVYGAHKHNHAHMTEDEPLRATQIFPELADAVELDHAATTFMWKNRNLKTIVLRPANIIGPSLRNTISELLRSRFAPKLMGYDPLLQFIHERDMAEAIRLCLKNMKSGVYNLAGEGVVSYSRAIELAGGRPVPVPSFIAYSSLEFLNQFGLSFPEHLMDYFRYPTTISDQEFRKDFGFEPKYDTVRALKSLNFREGDSR